MLQEEGRRRTAHSIVSYNVLMKHIQKPLIGFIGQGWIGKHYADDFERRKFSVIRYGLEQLHNGNKEKIKECDIVFIAIPTPTTPKGFDCTTLQKVIQLVGKKKIAVIKSTILPGITKSIQKKNPSIFVMHSPEFLTEATAAHDAAHPDRNIIGIPKNTPIFRKKAKEVLAILPKAQYACIMASDEAEFVKYGGNCWFYFKVVYINMLYDLSRKYGVDWPTIQNAMAADPRIGRTHLDPVHKSGRGAGGHCFIKDFAAFEKLYAQKVKDPLGIAALRAVEAKNTKLLKQSKKDLDLLRGVYGDTV